MDVIELRAVLFAMQILLRLGWLQASVERDALSMVQMLNGLADKVVVTANIVSWYNFIF